MRSRNLIKNFDLMRSDQIRSNDQIRSDQRSDRTQIRPISIKSSSKFDRILIAFRSNEFLSKFDRSDYDRIAIELWSNFDRFVIEFWTKFWLIVYRMSIQSWSNFWSQKFDQISIAFRPNFVGISIEFRVNFDRIVLENRSWAPPGGPWGSKGCSGTIWSVPGALRECPGSGPGAPGERRARHFWGLGIRTNSGTLVSIAFWTSWTQKWSNFGSIFEHFWTNFEWKCDHVRQYKNWSDSEQFSSKFEQ